MLKNIFFLFSLALLVSCGEPQSELHDLDLLSHGMPVSLKAPEGSEISKSSIAFQQEVVIKGSDNFNVLVSMDDVMLRDEAKLKEQKLSQAKENRYFFRVVEETENGFIYENRIDSTNSSYGFNYVRVKGDKEYIFQNARTGIFTLEEVKRMFEAVSDPTK